MIFLGRPSVTPLSGPFQPCLDAFHDQGPLEWGEHTAHLEQGFVEPLLMQVEIHDFRAELTEERQEMLQRAAQAIHTPAATRSNRPVMGLVHTSVQAVTETVFLVEGVEGFERRGPGRGHALREECPQLR